MIWFWPTPKGGSAVVTPPSAAPGLFICLKSTSADILIGYYDDGLVPDLNPPLQTKLNDPSVLIAYKGNDDESV